MKQKYLLDTCICAYWLRDKQNIRERINAVGMENSTCRVLRICTS